MKNRERDEKAFNEAKNVSAQGGYWGVVDLPQEPDQLDDALYYLGGALHQTFARDAISGPAREERARKFYADVKTWIVQHPEFPIGSHKEIVGVLLESDYDDFYRFLCLEQFKTDVRARNRYHSDNDFIRRRRSLFSELLTDIMYTEKRARGVQKISGNELLTEVFGFDLLHL